MNSVDISVYGILDPARSRGRDLADNAVAAVRGGVSLLQYRDKDSSARDIFESALRIRLALNGTQVPLIINDHVDIALAAEADGVHLGQDDMPADRARDILGPEAIIGMSVKSADDVDRLPVNSIDYVFIGGVFQTHSKDNPTAIGIQGWRTLADRVRRRAPGMPIGAIAGIDASNAGRLMAAGADGVAVISAIFMADDVAAAARALREIVDARAVAPVL